MRKKLAVLVVTLLMVVAGLITGPTVQKVHARGYRYGPHFPILI